MDEILGKGWNFNWRKAMTDEIEIDIEREAGEGSWDGKVTEEATNSKEFHVVKSTKKPKIIMVIIYDGYIYGA